MAISPVMTSLDLKINSERLRADFDELAEIGATIAGGVRRLALSAEDLQARTWFADKIESAGLPVLDDDAGNLSAMLYSDNPNARTVLIGSHLDTVPNAGKYDGSIGLLAGLEVLRTIKEAHIKLPVNLEVINFTDEEGAWKGLLGSQAVAGRLSPNFIHDMGEEGGAFRAALFRAGIRPNDVLKARRDAAALAGYIELHIEQGPRLDRMGIQIGVVEGIIGRTTYRVTFYGQSSHSGTTPFDMRRDALHGAATFITRAHEWVRESYPEGVFNCGSLRVHPGAFNVIPSKAFLTMEVRHVDEALLHDMDAEIVALAQRCADEHGLTVSTEVVAHVHAVRMQECVMEAIEETCRRFGFTHTRMFSYAGHDAQMMSTLTPSSMIFIPSIGGISHNPNEYSRWTDVENGANVLLHTALRMAMRTVEEDDAQP